MGTGNGEGELGTGNGEQGIEIGNRNDGNRYNGNEEWEQGIGIRMGMGTGNKEQGTFSDYTCVTLRYTNSLS